ncbi:hypothetical protein CPB97_002507 [Podila verticillata]|nr:hypothetical protein CPB97_002507 [Podila verticillata]
MERKTVKLNQDMELEAVKTTGEVSRIRLEHECAKLELVEERQRRATTERNMQEVIARGSSNTAQDFVDDSQQDMKDRDRRWCEASTAYKAALERAAADTTSNDLAPLEASRLVP